MAHLAHFRLEGSLTPSAVADLTHLTDFSFTVSHICSLCVQILKGFKFSGLIKLLVLSEDVA